MHPTSRVKCTLLQETWKSSDPWGGLLPESANDKFDFLVIKTHSIKALNDQMRKLAGHPSVFIFHSVESDGDWKHESKDHRCAPSEGPHQQYDDPYPHWTVLFKAVVCRHVNNSKTPPSLA